MKRVIYTFTAILAFTIMCSGQTIGTKWCYVMKVQGAQLKSQTEIKQLKLEADKSYKWGSTHGTYKLEGNHLTLKHDQGLVDHHTVNAVDKSRLKLIPNTIDNVVLYFIAYP